MAMVGNANLNITRKVVIFEVKAYRVEFMKISDGKIEFMGPFSSGVENNGGALANLINCFGWEHTPVSFGLHEDGRFFFHEMAFENEKLKDLFFMLAMNPIARLIIQDIGDMPLFEDDDGTWLKEGQILSKVL